MAVCLMLDGWFTIGCLRDKMGTEARHDEVLWQAEIGSSRLDTDPL